MTISKKIDRKLLQVWSKELQQYGIIKSAEEMEMNYRTLHAALKRGVCTQRTYDKVNDYLLSKREANKAKAKAVAEQDQD